MKIRGGDEPDIFGEYPVAWTSGSKDLAKIQEWLYSNYQGYKFAVVFDTEKEEYEELKEAPVYFLDCAWDEMLEYIGIEKAREWLAAKEAKRENNRQRKGGQTP